jgi:60 kDa SS-A/Ro ribonucleoprotein
MSTNYTKHFNPTLTSQSEAIPGENQIANNAGGYGYALDCWTQFTRFLIIGAEGGTFYVGEKKLTQENAKNVLECIKQDGVKAVRLIVDVSTSTRAPKNDPAIFALALVKVFGDPAAKQAMYAAIPKVCRIGTHLFQFCQYIQDMSSWSRGLRTAIGNWYADMTLEKLELQLVKYRQRQGWTHKDVLRLSHPKETNPEKNQLLKYAVGKIEDPQTLGGMIAAFERISQPKVKAKEIVAAIQEYKLPWEAIPTEMMKDRDVWVALLPHMGYTALLRNLARMTACDVFGSNLDSNVQLVMEKLSMVEKERVHPMAILLALKTYSSGHGHKGSLSWSPVRSIVDILSDAFYLSFGNVEATGKNLCLGIDVSGSMYGSMIAGTNLDAGTAAAAMALVTAATEKNYELLAYSHQLVPLTISPKMRLDTVIKEMRKIPMGGTDCSLPIKWAYDKGVKVDAFLSYTDNETWHDGYGRIGHPSQWLKKYREKMGIDAKLCEVGFTSTNISIADPNDRFSLSVVGFDAATPSIMSEFIKGNV